VIAYKFLRTGRVGPFSEFRWPQSGVWVRAEGEPASCRTGVHACRVDDLPWWLGEELWEIELDGEVEVHEHKIVAPAGRLRSRVDAWTPDCANEYGEACAWRARDQAVQALTRAEHEPAASRLQQCATLRELRRAARELAESIPDARISLLMAQDGAGCALTGVAPMAAYISAHAARQLDGPAAFDAERRWQSEWLARRLSLSADGCAAPRS
jgi:hypothetical protein